MNKKLCFFCPGLCGGLPFHSACYRWGPAYKNSQPCNLCPSLISITLLCCWFGEFVRSSWLTLPFFWQSTPSSRPARARHQPNMRSWGRLSYLGQKLYLWMDIVVEIKPFYLKKIGAGSILHQLLLRPCDCHKSIVTDLNLADMVQIMKDNVDFGKLYLGCRVQGRIPGRTLPPATSFASRHLN